MATNTISRIRLTDEPTKTVILDMALTPQTYNFMESYRQKHGMSQEEFLDVAVSVVYEVDSTESKLNMANVSAEIEKTFRGIIGLCRGVWERPISEAVSVDFTVEVYRALFRHISIAADEYEVSEQAFVIKSITLMAILDIHKENPFEVFDKMFVSNNEQAKQKKQEQNTDKSDNSGVYTVYDIQRILNKSRGKTYDFLNKIEKSKNPPFLVRRVGAGIRVPKKPFDDWLNGT